MKILKNQYGYSLILADNAHIFYDHFERDGGGVVFYRGNEMVAALYGAKASEFYKAWRAM